MGFRAVSNRGGNRFGNRGLAVALGTALVVSLTPVAAAAASQAIVNRSGASLASLPVSCDTSNPAYRALAARMVTNLRARIASRPSSTIGFEVADYQTKMTCRYHATYHFYAASVIKATILAALLRKAQEAHRSLTANEKHLATLMITQSDNSAASALWNELGIPFIQHVLNLAKMASTRLASAWGLSLLTADDEMKLLHVIAVPNAILTNGSRGYELGLMARVISSQRWGAPYGVVPSMTVHVKNGWLPYPSWQWEINSLGIFTRAGTKTVLARVYLMAFLTYSNPSMSYGVNTIQALAAQIHHDWNAGVSAHPAPTVSPSPSPSPSTSASVSPSGAIAPVSPSSSPSASPSDPGQPSASPSPSGG